MMRRFFSKVTPAVLLCGVFSSAALTGCGMEDELGSLSQEVHTTKSATLNQADFTSFTNAVNLKGCTFSIAGGNGAFTPSNELAAAIWGDPNGAAHKQTFAVPPISSSSASIDITSLDAEMNNTGFTVAGSTTTVKVAFHGLLKVGITVPVFGKLNADITINSSNIAVGLTYDKTNDRVQVASVTATISEKTKNCGGSGWCNGIFDSVLKSNLAGWIQDPLKDALNDVFADPAATAEFQDLLLIMYNRKDPSTPAWTLVPKTMDLSSGAFHFTVEHS